MDRHGQAWNDADAEGWAFVRDLNREVITLAPEEEASWQAAMEPILTDYVQRATAKGLPGAEMLAAIQSRLAAVEQQP